MQHPRRSISVSDNYIPATCSNDCATALTTALQELDPIRAVSMISGDNESAALFPENGG